MKTRIRRVETTGGLIFFQLFVECPFTERFIQFSSIRRDFKQITTPTNLPSCLYMVVMDSDDLRITFHV